MEALALTKVSCRLEYPQPNGTPYDNIVIGAIILKSDTGLDPKILLLKRSASEEFYPNKWEIPGGKVEDTDATISDAVKREAFEEIGIKVKILESTGSFAYTTEKKVVDETGAEVLATKHSLQFNYVCEAEGYEARVNPEEHSEGRYVDRYAVDELEMTEQMKEVVRGGFRWFWENGSWHPIVTPLASAFIWNMDCLWVLAKNGWYGIIEPDTLADPNKYPSIESVEQSGSRFSPKGVRCYHSNSICTSNDADATTYDWSNAIHRIFSLIGPTFPDYDREAGKMTNDIVNNEWADLEVLLDGAFNCTFQGRHGSDVVALGPIGALDLSYLSQLPIQGPKNGQCFPGSYLKDGKTCPFQPPPQ
ncbi:MAG: hypothetical protein Q9220_001787 [cf. Caloplaca sp. 1 TL-2023]